MNELKLKKTKLISNFVKKIITTYIILYSKYLIGKINRTRRRLPKPPEDDSDSYMDEYHAIKKEYDFLMSSEDRLEYRKFTTFDTSYLERLVYSNLNEVCTNLFKYTIEKYQFRILTLILVIFNFICFLTETLCLSRTLTFAFLELLLTNLPFWVRFIAVYVKILVIS